MSVYKEEQFKERQCRATGCLNISGNRVARRVHEAKNHDLDKIDKGDPRRGR